MLSVQQGCYSRSFQLVGSRCKSITEVMRISSANLADNQTETEESESAAEGKRSFPKRRAQVVKGRRSIYGRQFASVNSIDPFLGFGSPPRLNFFNSFSITKVTARCGWCRCCSGVCVRGSARCRCREVDHSAA